MVWWVYGVSHGKYSFLGFDSALASACIRTPDKPITKSRMLPVHEIRFELFSST